MTAMSFVQRAQYQWQLRTRTLQLGEQTRVMGIVNVTPDSFSDGGQHATTEGAVKHALRLLDAGADILDIGGESTRPGSPAATTEAISTAEEQDRVLPVIAGILQLRPDAVLSVDTYRAATARAAVQAGAEVVNDVSGGLWDAAMLGTCAELRCGTVLMHTRGLPSQWHGHAAADASVTERVVEELRERLQQAANEGVARDRIVADPGFGFGKRGSENWRLLHRCDAFADLGYPIMVGLSRKGFLSAELAAPQQSSTAVRDTLTHAANTAAVLAGAHLIRVHDVAGAVLAAATADAVLRAG